MSDDEGNSQVEIPATTCLPALSPTTDFNKEPSTLFQESVDVPNYTNHPSN